MNRLTSIAASVVIILIICSLASCTKAPLNETKGSFFLHENTRVEFEDKGYMIKDLEGNISIACFSGPRVIGESRDCINILVPKDRYTLKNNRLTFRSSFDAKIRFFTKFYEHGGHAEVAIYFQQNTKVHVSGAITNDTPNDIFQEGNVYPCPFSISFTLEDGTSIRLQMNTITITDEMTLISGWL